VPLGGLKLWLTGTEGAACFAGRASDIHALVRDGRLRRLTAAGAAERRAMPSTILCGDAAEDAVASNDSGGCAAGALSTCVAQFTVTGTRRRRANAKDVGVTWTGASL